MGDPSTVDFDATEKEFRALAAKRGPAPGLVDAVEGAV
jgi:hypothetical protein